METRLGVRQQNGLGLPVLQSGAEVGGWLLWSGAPGSTWEHLGAPEHRALEHSGALWSTQEARSTGEPPPHFCTTLEHREPQPILLTYGDSITTHRKSRHGEREQACRYVCNKPVPMSEQSAIKTHAGEQAIKIQRSTVKKCRGGVRECGPVHSAHRRESMQGRMNAIGTDHWTLGAAYTNG